MSTSEERRPMHPDSTRAAAAETTGEADPPPGFPQHADSPSSRLDDPCAPAVSDPPPQHSSLAATISDVRSTEQESSGDAAQQSRPGLRHKRTIEVSWGDCDAAGVVFYPRYYAWFDACTHAMLSQVGLDHHRLRRDLGLLGTPLVRADATFLSPVTYEDVLTAVSEIVALGERSFTVRHRFSKNGRLAVEGTEVRVWAVETEGRPPGIRAIRPDPAWRALLWRG